MACVGGAKSDEPSDNVKSHCDRCRHDGLIKGATTLCRECEEYMCTPCAKMHQGFKQLRDHELVSVGQLSSSAESDPGKMSLSYCTKHADKLMDLFCADHEAMFCSSCRLVQHRKCEVVSLVDKAKVTTCVEEFTAALESMVALKVIIETLKGERENDIAALNNLRISRVEEITQFKTKLTELIESLEKKILDDIENVVATEMNVLQEHVATFDVMLPQLEMNIRSAEDETSPDKMPVCAVEGCGNGDYKLNKWKSENCQVHIGFKKDIGQCICPPPFVLNPFPTEARDSIGRKKWVQLVNRKDEVTGKNWTPKRYSRVCSVHFPDGTPTVLNPNPVLCMGYNVAQSQKSSRKPPKPRNLLYTRTEKLPSTQSEVPDVVEEEMYTAIPLKEFVTADHDYATNSQNCSNCEVISKSVKELRNENCQLKQKIGNISLNAQKTSVINRFITSDNKVRLNTGLPNKQTLDALYNHVSAKTKNMRYWLGSKKVTSTKVRRKFLRTPKKFGPRRKLKGKEELVLVLMKLRVGVTNEFLCDVFGIGAGTCSQIINTWIRFLAKELKPLVFWPDRTTVTKLLPAELAAKFPKLRCTLDCTEIYIDRPRHMELQALTWSDYKRHNTAKYLVGIAPNGMISFLSSGWGGRTSDKHIVNESGFLDLVDPGDVILADRGFTINAELLMRGAKLEIPPPSSGWEQQTPEAVSKTKKVANARIHVERAIGRMKWFSILKNTVPISLVPILDDIVMVCVALCNLLPPLVGQ